MSKYIDAEAVAAIVRKKADGETNERKKSLTLGIAEFLEELMAELPAVEIAPVKRGKWKESAPGTDNFSCTVCGWGPIVDSDFGPVLSDYCPNCGAKMEGVS